jgi:hypothetical protein
MPYLAVNKNGEEMIFDDKPQRTTEWIDTTRWDRKQNKKISMPVVCWNQYELDPDGNYIYYGVTLPKGTIEKLTGKILTWEDEPLEYI